MNSARIVLERHGELWHWELTERGQRIISNGGQPTPVLACDEAEKTRLAAQWAIQRVELVN